MKAHCFKSFSYVIYFIFASSTPNKMWLILLFNDVSSIFCPRILCTWIVHLILQVFFCIFLLVFIKAVLNESPSWSTDVVEIVVIPFNMIESKLLNCKAPCCLSLILLGQHKIIKIVKGHVVQLERLMMTVNHHYFFKDESAVLVETR